jgi:hypothetical protein
VVGNSSWRIVPNLPSSLINFDPSTYRSVTGIAALLPHLLGDIEGGVVNELPIPLYIRVAVFTRIICEREATTSELVERNLHRAEGGATTLSVNEPGHARAATRLDTFQSFAQFNCVVTVRGDLALIILNNGDCIRSSCFARATVARLEKLAQLVPDFLARKPAAQRSRCNAQKLRGLELVKTKEGEMFLQFARRHHCRDSSAIMSNAIRPRWRRGWSIERPGRLSPASDVVPVPLPAYVG